MTIKTKFGKAYVDTQGYLRIFSRKEGNCNKLVHRLVFEDFYQIKLSKNTHIHHEDGNKLNNEIWNLIPLNPSEHSRIHGIGVKCTEETRRKISKSLKGHKYSEESKEKMRQAKLGKKQPLDMRINRSKTTNKLGLFRVFKSQNKSCKQGFDYCYNYTENGKTKTINSVNILKLKEKVINRGWEWIVLDEDKVINNFDKKTAESLIGEAL